MLIKELLPVALRDKLRPKYQKLKHYLLETSWYPKPADWCSFREKIKDVKELENLFLMAEHEFGIIQIKQELFPFLSHVKAYHPLSVGEIGTHKGGNSFLFSHFFKPKQLICIDLCVQNREKLKFYAPSNQKVTCINGDSSSAETVAKVKQVLCGQKFDFLFIDGDHSYEGVKRDFLTYYELVKIGGLIAFHDILPDHNTRYGSQTNCYAGGVHLLWNELRERFPSIEFVSDANQNGFGIGVIEKVSASCCAL